MPAKKPSAPKRDHKPDNPEQSQRFIETARELGADETGEEFRKALKKIAPSRSVPEK
jgi:hypothetical protein